MSTTEGPHAATRMTAFEWRATGSLAAIFGLRMLGLFIVLPVFAIYARALPGGDSLTLVGIALGAYGLTQAILQIPFGWLSDRIGRKLAIQIGLVLFAAGSLVAAAGQDLLVVAAGRALQGAGAISAAIIALAADLTREEVRTRAMALIGSTIGATFAVSLVIAPSLGNLIGVPGIFAMTGILAFAAMAMVRWVVPDPEIERRPVAARGALRVVVLDPELFRLDVGVFVLHAVLMSLFVIVPLELERAGQPVAAHARIYLGVMLASFVLMLPAILFGERGGRARMTFVGAVVILLVTQVAGLWVAGSVTRITLMLTAFFTAFNVLEASLPSRVSRVAPTGARGVAIGIFSTLQFLGTFVGAAAGGWIAQRWGLGGVCFFNAGLLAIWLAAATGMRAAPGTAGGHAAGADPGKAA
jgi:MFS family permease